MSSHPVDLYVGKRLRARRTILRLCQEELGEAVNVTFQQIQKYERGLNRISASKLYELSVRLGVPISYFFDGYTDGEDTAPLTLEEGGINFLYEKLHSKEMFQLVDFFSRIADNRMRKIILDLLRSLTHIPTE